MPQRGPHNYNKLESGERPTHVYFAKVTGIGDFPFDMLRYDACWPQDSQDVVNMTHVYRELETNRQIARTVKLKSFYQFTPARWASFGWNLTGVTPYGNTEVPVP